MLAERRRKNLFARVLTTCDIGARSNMKLNRMTADTVIALRWKHAGGENEVIFKEITDAPARETDVAQIRRLGSESYIHTA